MENYILNSSTIALLKSNKKTIIIEDNNIKLINKNIKNIININCLINGSSYNGRKEYSKKIINSTYKIPIYINKNITIISLNSIRNKNTLILVLNKINNYKYKNNKLFIKCRNYTFIENLSINRFEKLLLKAIKINNNLNNENYENFV